MYQKINFIIKINHKKTFIKISFLISYDKNLKIRIKNKNMLCSNSEIIIDFFIENFLSMVEKIS